MEPGFFERTGFRRGLATRAASIDRRTNTVTTQDGEVAARQARAGHRLQPLRAPRCRGATAPTALCTAPSKTWKPWRPQGQGRSGVVIGGGLLGLECAKALRDMGLETHVVEFAPPDGGAGGRRRRPGCRPRSSAWACRCTRAATRSRSPTAPAPATAWCLPTARTWRPTWSSSRPAFGRATSWRGNACWPWAARGHRHRQRLPHQRPRHVRHWRMRLMERTDLWPGGPGLRHGPRGGARHVAGDARAAFTGADMSTKLKLMGVDVASIGDAQARSPGCRSCQYVDERRQVTRRSSSAKTASNCWARC